MKKINKFSEIKQGRYYFWKEKNNKKNYSGGIYFVSSLDEEEISEIWVKNGKSLYPNSKDIGSNRLGDFNEAFFIKDKWICSELNKKETEKLNRELMLNEL